MTPQATPQAFSLSPHFQRAKMGGGKRMMNYDDL
jgi:hypothetical protein